MFWKKEKKKAFSKKTQKNLRSDLGGAVVYDHF